MSEQFPKHTQSSREEREEYKKEETAFSVLLALPIQAISAQEAVRHFVERIGDLDE